MYFNETTERKLVEYQQTRDDRIFEKYLYVPFEKIASSLLHKLKTYAIDGDLDVIIQETITFMWSKMDKFDPTRGFKAYSYFSLVARNFLINENKKAQNRQNKTKNIFDYDFGDNDSDLDIMNCYESEGVTADDGNMSSYINKYFKNRMDNIVKIYDKNIDNFMDREKNIVLTIIEMMNNCEFFYQDDFANKNIKKIISMLSGESEKNIKIVLGKISSMINFFKDEIDDSVYSDIVNIFK